MYGGDCPRDPWRRAFVEITCQDSRAAADKGDEDAIALDDEMRCRNRGAIFVYARPDDNIWKLGLEALQVIPDMLPEPTPTDLFMHEPGNA